MTILVLRSQSGDREAIDLLLRSIQQRLWRFVRGVIGNDDIAEDVLQDTFWLIYRKIRWLNEPDLLMPWAYRIASRECLRRIRKEARWRDQVRDEAVLDAIPASSAPVFETDLIQRLPGLLANVSPASRVVLVLHYLDELSIREVAEILDISPGTVRSRLSYGLATLRRHLSETQIV